MNNIMKKEFKNIAKKEERFLRIKETKKEISKVQEWKDKVNEKIPETLKNTLEVAFYKSFLLIFEKGTGVIEKSYDREKMVMEHDINNYAIKKKITKKNLNRVDSQAKKSKLGNTCVSVIEGIGLGVFGIGIPDIPLFTGMILKGIYEIAVSYGFDYGIKEEKRYILYLIQASLCIEEEKSEINNKVECQAKRLSVSENMSMEMDEDIKMTAKLLSEAMLMAKFVQGMPVIGIVGGMFNFPIYQKIIGYATFKYKKRYLQDLIGE